MLAAFAVMPRTTAISAGASCSQAHRRSSSASSARSAAIASARASSAPEPSPGPGTVSCGGSTTEIFAATRCCRRAPRSAFARQLRATAYAHGNGGSGSSSRRRQHTSSVSDSTSSAVAASVRRARNRRNGSIRSGASPSNRSRRVCASTPPPSHMGGCAPPAATRCPRSWCGVAAPHQHRGHRVACSCPVSRPGPSRGGGGGCRAGRRGCGRRCRGGSGSPAGR